MNVLYISYWGINESLTDSTVFPHLKIAAEIPAVRSITLVTVERAAFENKNIDIQKTKHIPLIAAKTGINTLNKILDFIFFPSRLVRIAQENKIDLIVAKGVLAGALAHKLSKKIKVPFVTESFEPHADYMAESAEWNTSNLKYKFLKKWETEQIRDAKHLCTVSENYKDHLLQHYGSKNVSNIPCCVDDQQFQYSAEQREKRRKELGITNEITGIYVGKFGGIYYDEEAFMIFKKAFAFFPSFRLVILSPNPKDEILKKLKNEGIDTSRTSILFVPHTDVASYLSASDFAFSTIKPSPSRQYCCPVKDGEYWANGLPILLTNGVGDDYKIIEKENAGALYDLDKNDLETAFKKIAGILEEKTQRERILKIAQHYRSFDIVRKVYGSIFAS